MSVNNPDMDIEQIKKGAAEGNAHDLYALGIAYYKGISVNSNISDAIKYLIDSAANGFFYSYTILGDIYNDSKCNYYNIDKAKSYYSLAADNGDYNAIVELSAILLDEYDQYASSETLRNLIKLKKSAQKFDIIDVVTAIDKKLIRNFIIYCF